MRSCLKANKPCRSGHRSTAAARDSLAVVRPRGVKVGLFVPTVEQALQYGATQPISCTQGCDLLEQAVSYGGGSHSGGIGIQSGAQARQVLQCIRFLILLLRSASSESRSQLQLRRSILRRSVCSASCDWGTSD